MLREVKSIVNTYLDIFPEEEKKLKKLCEYLENETERTISDWNNVNGHITAGIFVYAKLEKKFLVLLNKDFEGFMYPGGHSEFSDKTPLDTAKKELLEETGIKDFLLLKLNENEIIPFDIDIHLIDYNQKHNMPEHFHYDFRYLVTIEKIDKIEIDKTETKLYKWIDIEELHKDNNYNHVISKIEKIINDNL